MTNPDYEDYTVTYGPTLRDKFVFGGFMTVTALSIVANIIIIFAILRFKKLRQDVTNNIILNLCMLEIVYYVLRVVENFGLVPVYETWVWCSLRENIFCLELTLNLFTILLVCEWYIKTYITGWQVKFSRYCKFMVWGLHGWNTIFSTAMFLVCVKDLTGIKVSMLILHYLFFCIFVLFVINVNVVHLVKKKNVRNNKHNIGLALANIFCITLIPFGLVSLVLFIKLEFNDELIRFVLTIAVSSPIFTLCYLFYCVDTFSIAFKKIFKCQCDDFSNESSDNQTVSYTIEQGATNNKD